jgi:uncharacterized protein HemX
MARRYTFWRLGAALYFFINGAGAIFAAANGEAMHAGAHVALLLLGAGVYAAWRFRSPPQQEDLRAVAEANERVQHLEQSLNSIALNVERIGEAQRYERKILEERIEVPPPKKEN